MPVTDPYCKSLMHFDGADESIDFIDETGKIWTANGSAQIDIDQKKFGTGCGLFDGVNSYITTPSHEDFSYGTGDVTIEFQVRLAALPAAEEGAYGLYSHVNWTTFRNLTIYVLNYYGTLKLGFNCVSEEDNTFWKDGEFPFVTDTWYHIALVKHDGVITLYVDGNPVTDPVDMGSESLPQSGDPLWLGAFADFSNYLNGWTDEFRISKGKAQWTGPFTPPTAPYTGNETYTPTPPVLTGLVPSPGQTLVDINRPISFKLTAQGDDGVDINTVTVQIGSQVYQKGDPEFSYVGNSTEYAITITHPDWDLEETLTVKINASSMLGGAIDEKEYSFTTKWASSLTRKGSGRIELFETGKYELSILTIQEDWVRQGVARYTADLELWYGRYMNIPKADDVQLVVVPGDSVRRGSDVVENGYFKVRVGGSGIYTPMYEDTVIHLGGMYPNTKKLIGFELIVPEDAVTKGYVMFELQFTPKIARLWGQYPWGRGIYGSGSGSGVYDFHPDRIYYRTYVFDKAAWSVLETGIAAYPSYRGEDKQW